MNPSVGRIVHYTDDGGGCVVGIVTLVIPEFQPGGPNDSVVLTLFPPGMNPVPVDHSHHDENKSPYTWHWPERVD